MEDNVIENALKAHGMDLEEWKNEEKEDNNA